MKNDDKSQRAGGADENAARPVKLPHHRGRDYWFLPRGSRIPIFASREGRHWVPTGNWRGNLNDVLRTICGLKAGQQAAPADRLRWVTEEDIVAAARCVAEMLSLDSDTASEITRSFDPPRDSHATAWWEIVPLVRELAEVFRRERGAEWGGGRGRGSTGAGPVVPGDAVHDPDGQPERANGGSPGRREPSRRVRGS